jgi:DNA-directed RNA polymerase subunit RPC12/RpoP
MQKTVEDHTEDGFASAFKGAAVALAVVASIPIFIPTAACVLALTEIKEKFKKCPLCSSRKLVFKGVETHGQGGCLEIRFDRGTFRKRRAPVHSFFRCADCAGQFKKVYGGPLLSASDEEFSEMAANSF